MSKALATLNPVGPANVTELSGAQKAAVLLMAQGTERAAAVLRQLRDGEVTEIAYEIARLGDVEPDIIDAVMEEFAITARAKRQLAFGGVETARELLQAGLGADRAESILGGLAMTFRAAPFEFVRRIEPRMLLSFIKDEHPQTIALVLAHMTPDAAALVLSGLSDTIQRDVAVRLATMDRTSPEIIATVEAALERRLSALAQDGDLAAAGGVQTLVDVLNRADRATERLIFEGLEQHDAQLADEVRSQMFVFEDICGLDDRAIQQVLRQVDSKDLAKALKGVRDEVRLKVTRNLSQRAAENLEEEIATLGPVRIKQVEEAQGAVVRVIRALEEAGSIVLVRSGDEFID